MIETMTSHQAARLLLDMPDKELRMITGFEGVWVSDGIVSIKEEVDFILLEGEEV